MNATLTDDNRQKDNNTISNKEPNGYDELTDLKGQIDAIYRTQAVIEFELDGTIIFWMLLDIR